VKLDVPTTVCSTTIAKLFEIFHRLLARHTFTHYPVLLRSVFLPFPSFDESDKLLVHRILERRAPGGRMLTEFDVIRSIDGNNK
jgi:hypothetical protein